MGALLWALALALFVGPFLLPQSAAGPEGDDPGRAASETDIPFDEDVAYWAEEFGEDLATPLAEASDRWFAPDAEVFGEGGLLVAARVAAGERAYDSHCISCHGSSGDGAGPGARHLSPRPRNFRRGIFKFSSTPTGARPRREDIMRTVTYGLTGSSMPSFRLLSEEVRHDVVEYVRYLAIRGECEQLALDLAWEEEELPDFDEAQGIVFARWSPKSTRTAYPAIAETDADAASIERGRVLYNNATVADCAKCHGVTGIGDGPSAKAFTDDWGYPIAPRDLTTGVFRAGSDAADLYRSIANGVKGTPMPSFSSLAPEGIWDLAHYVQSMSEGN